MITGILKFSLGKIQVKTQSAFHFNENARKNECFGTKVPQLELKMYITDNWLMYNYHDLLSWYPDIYYPDLLSRSLYIS